MIAVVREFSIYWGFAVDATIVLEIACIFENHWKALIRIKYLLFES
jgi:hypothetical protein